MFLPFVFLAAQRFDRHSSITSLMPEETRIFGRGDASVELLKIMMQMTCNSRYITSTIYTTITNHLELPAVAETLI